MTWKAVVLIVSSPVWAPVALFGLLLAGWLVALIVAGVIDAFAWSVRLVADAVYRLKGGSE